MPRILVCLALALSLGPADGAAQQRLRTTFDDAVLSWDRGHYPDALRSFGAILDDPAGGAFLREIAEITGEPYQTIELAPDGTNPRWSSDGQWLSYETASDDPVRSQIVSVDDGRSFSVNGTGATFAIDGNRVAFLTVADSPERDRERAVITRRPPPRSFAERWQRRRALAEVDARYTRVWVRDLESEEVTGLDVATLAVFEIVFAGGSVFALASERNESHNVNLYVLDADRTPRRLTADGGSKVDLQVSSNRARLLFTDDGGSFGLHDVASGQTDVVPGFMPTVSADGSTAAFLRFQSNGMSLHVMRAGETPREVTRVPHRIDAPALSPNGDRVAFQAQPRENWELMVVRADGTDLRRLTWDVQHDLFPRFLDAETILAVKGEGRHRRSYLFDASTGAMTRFFHNNTIRTVAPEYEWAASPDGSRVLIVSERDGDTISPERGIYLVDRTQALDVTVIRDRIEANLVAEMRLREDGERLFGRIHSEVEAAVAEVSTPRIYRYEADLFAFGSKFITQPGNARAIEYLAAALERFGYDPELQWFEPRPGVRSANVIATLRGTVDPDLIYVVSSHFDSVERGPGADDNTSGTAALLEAAGVLADRPQPATIKFAFFTGEEAGLRGSREFVRRAVAAGDRIVGALNNDMVGYANDHRLDNTIRYSNAGIRDVQHAAAILYSNLITYDAKYYKSTDAHAYYEAYGDIVGGIGSYPILANPHYHQTHDVLETINHQLVAEVSKATIATIQLLASSPARLTGLQAQRRDGALNVAWTPAAESSVASYVVRIGDTGTVRTAEAPQITLTDVPPGVSIAVKAVDARGTESWDWAYVTSP